MRTKQVWWFCVMAVCVGLAWATSAQGALVYVLDEDSYGGPIGGFYSGLYGGPGGSAAYISGDLSSYSFAGVSMLWAVPADPFTPAEIGTMASFLNNGGHIGFLGAWFSEGRKASINAAVADLGGHISLNPGWVDGAYPYYAHKSNGQIISDPVTAGVNLFVYGPFSPLSVSGPAQSLIFGSDMSSVQLAYENIGAGTIFVMGGQSAWDLDPFSAGTDNRALFINMLTVPEPMTLSLLAMGGLALVRKRR